MSRKSKDRGPLLFMLWFAMAVATWGVGLTSFLPPAEAGRESFYLTLSMLTVAELLICLYFDWMLYGSVGHRNMPLQIGGGVMLLLYVAGVLALTLLAAAEMEFKWLLLSHVGALVLLISALGVISLATKHADKQDEEDEERLAPFIALRDRYENLCDRIEATPDSAIGKGKRKAVYLRDEVFRYARIDSTPRAESADRDVDNALTALESILNLMANTQANDVADALASSLDALENAMKRREKRLGGMR